MASVRALIVDRGRILLLQRAAATTRAGQWCLPGGRIQSQETAEAAVVRETCEEAGVKIRVLQSLRRFGSCEYFLCELSPDKQTIRLQPKECQAWAWVEAGAIEKVGMIMDYRQLKRILADPIAPSFDPHD
ncbi:MAG: NUDIX hydrolase [Candidatus Sericytochromatia bacterium]